MELIAIAEELKKNIAKEHIYLNEPMKKHTTFKVGGNADIFVKASTVLEIMHTLKVANENEIPLTVIGNGSNLLVKDNGIRGIVLKIGIDHYEILAEKENISIVVDSGMLNAKLAQILMEDGIAGFEFASGIPGTIGGAVKMNAGAYGGEFKDIVEETIYLDLEDKKIKALSKPEHEFSYRHSIFEEKKGIILNTKLKLNVGNKADIQEKMNQNLNARKEKQPIEYPSAGSTFKRGEDFIAAKLIDECGLKGTTIGGAEVSTKHAGFIINKGSATAEDILKLIQLVKDTVLEKTGKELKLEIEIMGE